LQTFRQSCPETALHYPDVQEFGQEEHLGFAKSEALRLRQQSSKIFRELKHSRRELVESKQKLSLAVDPSQFDCLVCLTTAQDAVETPCCAALGCNTCFRRLTSCPICRAPLHSLVPSKAVRRIISRLLVVCPYNGCSQVIEHGCLQRHLAICSAIKRNCKYLCGVELQSEDKAEKEAHEDKCPQRPHQCTQCGEDMLFVEVDSHVRRTCLMVNCPCPICHADVLRRDLQAHFISHKRWRLVPQMVFFCLMIITAILGVILLFTIRKILQNT